MMELKPRVDDFIAEHLQPIPLTGTEMRELCGTGNIIDIIKYAFCLGYMKGQGAEKGGAA